jgi:spermidine/putrescine transport system permease protein
MNQDEATLEATERTPASRVWRFRRPFRAGPHYSRFLVLPTWGYLAAFLIAPAIVMAVYALALQSATTFGAMSFGVHWTNLWTATHGLYVDVFFRTLKIAVVGTALTIAVGLPVAYWLARHVQRYKHAVLVFLVVPFWTAFLIRTYAWLILLDPRFPVDRAMGVNIAYSQRAVLIGMVYDYLPLFILPAYATLERIDWSMVDAAHDLYCGYLTAFRKIVLPLARTGIITGALLVFVPMMGEYVVPQILGGGTTNLEGTMVANAFFNAQNWPLGAAIAIVLIGFLILVSGTLVILARRGAVTYEA